MWFFLLTEQPFIIRLTMQIFLKSINIALDLLHYKKKDWIMRRNYKALFVYLYYLLRAFCGMLLIRNFIKHWYSFGGKIIGFVKFKV